ncbi:hypothetical protein ASPWEDRAFT_184392 [Aspergillus wentii DTO 134E9]|uniref:GXWXG domain-containing protein n=1 Tax=Aspergillus wentii DTO 134E9 TaxID=1073089 RepID=A0A1L9RG47_ASPWE|nr:uncharacterized protein ASPWEDRAFT_184392 [Aspergillus wentii DTO 134E9]OJJ33837.1 hypothetical protein ASPWEDRAFT_184392 [Aspergillus wentii DTO 134E9]
MGGDVTIRASDEDCGLSAQSNNKTKTNHQNDHRLPHNQPRQLQAQARPALPLPRKSPNKLEKGALGALFNHLKPVNPDQLIGDWDGHAINTEHPFTKELDAINWAGNSFDATRDDDVDLYPTVILRNGHRVPYEGWGFASLREIKYNGVVSSALIYNTRPALVHFRHVNDRVVAGVMESREFGKNGNFYFYLVK